jgi:hypothetical protein
MQLPRPSLLERYTNLFLAFTFSGIFHVFIDLGNGKTALGLTMLFFQSSALGIMMEDGVQALWRKYSGEKFMDKDNGKFTWKKVVGFVWVICFFSLVAPWYTYPAARMPSGREMKLPIQFTKSYGDKAAITSIVVLGSILVGVFKAEI